MFFFFKQKTAYEMRISDWSSDVCSSDLYPHRDHRPGRHSHSHARKGLSGGRPGDSQNARSRGGSISATVKRRQADGLSDARRRIMAQRFSFTVYHDRSEEHTSEIQSIMRISYAGFCLKKKHLYQT